MKKSIFTLSKMDCSAEEQLVSLKLSGLKEVKNLAFDLSERSVTIVHAGDITAVEDAIQDLNLGAIHISSEYTDEREPIQPKDERRLLIYVLAINAFFFVLEMTTGILSNSMGLVADSLDMLADAFVYGLSLLVVGSTMLRKKRMARSSGYLQLLLAVVGLTEILRRFWGLSEVPVYSTMIAISFLALFGNVACLIILRKARSNDPHMRASQIFTSNDVIINTGVLVAGVLVFLTGSKIPDLIIGSIVFVIVVRGAFRILNLAK